MVTQTEKLSYSVRETATALGIGMNQAYSLVHRDGFPAIFISPKKIIIPVDGLREWLQREGGRADA